MKSVTVLRLVAVLVVAMSCGVAPAQNYPTKLIRLVVATPPAGSNDLMARLVAPPLSERLGQQIIIENHGGAGGTIGNALVARAAPDGYTLLVASIAFTVVPSFYKLTYDPIKAFVAVSKIPSANMMLVVHPSVPVRSMRELINLAKGQPGKLNFAASGTGSGTHLATELFKSMAKADFVIVQFKGGGPALIDTLGGHTDASFGSLLQFLPHIKSGKLRALGTCGTIRSSMFPQVPTIAEAGLPGYDASSWLGILAPAGTPPPVLGRLEKELAAVFSMPEIQKSARDQGAEIDRMSAVDFRALIPAEIAKWAKLVNDAKIKVN